ncbi:MAG: hypothetical protein JO022_20775 [Acidobacteriaceae bacterium]|nr:hypothetical protein [Acidobacteriaceae bacterium]
MKRNVRSRRPAVAVQWRRVTALKCPAASKFVDADVNLEVDLLAFAVCGGAQS